MVEYHTGSGWKYIGCFSTFDDMKFIYCIFSFFIPSWYSGITYQEKLKYMGCFFAFAMIWNSYTVYSYFLFQFDMLEYHTRSIWISMTSKHLRMDLSRVLYSIFSFFTIWHRHTGAQKKNLTAVGSMTFFFCFLKYWLKLFPLPLILHFSLSSRDTFFPSTSTSCSSLLLSSVVLALPDIFNCSICGSHA